MIEISNLNKHFGDHHVLKNLSLEFPSGSVTAVIGPNGSGKTTLMKSILGLVSPNEGSIKVNGIQAINNAESRESVGYMAQIARYPENLTAQEVIDMVRGLRKRDVGAAMKELIDRFDLTPHLNKPMRALSGGTRQKVGAVIALMFKPEALLLDEPTAGLDPIATESLKSEILSCRERGATVLITSHILTEIQELANRVVYLHEGNIVYDGNIQALLERSGTDSLPKAIASMMGSGSHELKEVAQ